MTSSIEKQVSLAGSHCFYHHYLYQLLQTILSAFHHQLTWSYPVSQGDIAEPSSPVTGSLLWDPFMACIDVYASQEDLSLEPVFTTFLTLTKTRGNQMLCGVVMCLSSSCSQSWGGTEKCLPFYFICYNYTSILLVQKHFTGKCKYGF